MTRRTRTIPPGAELALFVEGGDEERMVQRLLPAVPCFVLPLEGRDGAWNLVAAVFAALQVPTPSAHGAVESDGTWTFGAFVLPGVRKGSSEALLLETAEPAVRRCIDQFFACTPNRGTTTARADKARAWALAAATLPGLFPAVLHALAGRPP